MQKLTKAQRQALEPSEREFMDWIIGFGTKKQPPGLARIFKWRIYHTWRSDHSESGFPDLVLVRGHVSGDGRVIFAELKVKANKPSVRQQEWLDDLTAVEGVEVYVWYPHDFHSGEIERILR